MNNKSIGWVIFIGCIGMMSSLMALDIGTLKDWHDATKPAFVGGQLGHLGTVIAAFIGGKIIPVDREITERTRATDLGKISDNHLNQINKENP